MPRTVVPYVSLDKILGHSVRPCIHQLKFRKSQSIFLLCCLAIPEQSQLVALIEPVSDYVDRFEVDLSCRMPIFRGLCKPMLRSIIALGYTLAIVIEQAQSVLSSCVLCFS